MSGEALEAGHLRVPRAEFTFTFATSGGAGGQNVNKVSSKAVLRWDLAHSPSIPDDVRVEASRRYIEAAETIMGKPFVPNLDEPQARMRKNLGLA